jgi:drug/metabolite transporter (DMT)-like permease
LNAHDPWLIAAILLSALVHAIWNLQVKSSSDRLATLISIRCVGLVFGMCVIGFVAPPLAPAWPFLLAAAAVHYVYFWFMIRAYELGDFSQVYPIARGSAPMLVALITVIFASEPLSSSTLVGVFLMSVGIGLLCTGKATIKAVMMALGMGCMIALYSYLSGRGIRLAGHNLSYMAWLEALASVLMVILGVTTMRGRMKAYLQSSWRPALMAGTLSVGGYMIALWAMTYLTIAEVVAVRETSVLFGAVLGAYILKEALATRRIVAALLVVIGVMVLAFSPGG